MESNSGNNGPIWAAVLSGSIALLAIIYQEHRKIEFERVQFESSLILNAIDKNDIESSKKGIKFLIESGLISDKNDKIIKLLSDSTFSIKLPQIDTVIIEPSNQYEFAESASSHKTVYLRSGQILDENDKPIEGVEIMINPCFSSEKNQFYNCQVKAVTDKNGLFKIPIPRQGNYKFLIQKSGYEKIYGLQRSSRALRYSTTIKLEKE